MVFLLLCVACVIQALHYYPRLPAEVAHHFGVSGQPDAWGSKLHFLIIYLVTVAVMAATFLGFGLAMPKMPNARINLPNKDYWLAPERRQQTLDYMLPRFLWLGSITMLLLFDVFQQSFQVHLGKATKLDHVLLSLGSYVAVITVWCIVINTKFRKGESEQSAAV